MSRSRRKKSEFGDVAANIYPGAGVDGEVAAAGGRLTRQQPG